MSSNLKPREDYLHHCPLCSYQSVVGSLHQPREGMDSGKSKEYRSGMHVWVRFVFALDLCDGATPSRDS